MNQIFNQYVSSGMAFGAQRWLGILQRQCERLASLMARNISDLGGISSLHLIISFNFWRLYNRFVLFEIAFCSDTISRSTKEFDESGSEDDQNILYEH